ncbi:methyltransferase, FxLD system [Actinospica durhamensis]|uniref:Protein-L-isoaspartate O-methyltransferase n=1 Tax=Actinospica durhamensis TaxID=1508375 RepID=A0A941ERV8_9ACTN|nr:methyltransferase, FxLD system [Actinospica durhamensis]MBR7832684.1 methyltransferase, FxLD system [Actinospica durhamensis]
MDTPSEPSADALRAAMTTRLRDEGTIRGAAVAAAFRDTPRHLFLPGIGLHQAYADSVVPTKFDAYGKSISAASQPTIVALMLEQLDVRRGQSVLEVGAGTGYNAALLGHLVGRSGRVVTVDVDRDLVEGAAAHLRTAGADNVEAVLGDGALGHPAGAPYDRISVTVGAGDIPPAWAEQLAPRGRLVVPLRLRGDVTLSLALDLAPGGLLYSRSAQGCTFMPLRGIADDADHVIDLTPDGSVSVHLHHEHELEHAADPAELARALDHPTGEIATGVLLEEGDSFAPLDLYLTCALPGGLCRLTASPSADPGLFGGGMAAVSGGSLACVTVFPNQDPDADAEPEADLDADPGLDPGLVRDPGAYLPPGPRPRLARGWEIGVTAFGPHGAKLAETVAGYVQAWNREARGAQPRFTVAQGSARADLTGRFVVDKRYSRIVVDWH